MFGRRRRLALLAIPASVCAGCSSGSHATTPPPSTSNHTPGASPTAQVIGTTRTVLATLGLNIHSDTSTTAAVVGVAAQGTQLSVLDYKSSNGGWYKVQGQSVTGWIVANPALTAQGQFTSYQSDARGFAVLYPANWTFAEETTDVLFRPQQGTSSIVVRTSANTAAFGQSGLPGYASVYENDSLVVCGYTGTLSEYARTSGSAGATPTPGGSSAMPLGLYAQIRLRFDSSHAMEIAYNYQSQGDLDIYTDFYNSITFPYPLCEAPASPAPSPT